MTRLAGRTALVTGASRGLGRASALALAGMGAQVLVHYSRGVKEAEPVVAEIRKAGGRADAVAADLSAPQPWRSYPMRCRWAELVSQVGDYMAGRNRRGELPVGHPRRNTRRCLMSNYTHQTAPTQFVDAAGIRLAYRRFGARSDIPLLFFMHFTGTMDHWDPAVTDGFARDREVILFNNAGVSSSSGEVPTSIEEMAQHATAFINALGVKKLDALGFSIGGFVAQQFTMDRPDLVRKVILVGTGPRGGEGMASLTPEGQEIFGATYDPADELWLRAFFTPSERSQAAGRKYLERQRARKENRDPLPNEKVAPAQLAALQKWGAPAKDPYAYLKKITQPTLVVNGSNDVLVYTVNSFILQQNLPDAQLILYSDSNHGAQYQYPELFVEHATQFLKG